MLTLHAELHEIQGMGVQKCLLPMQEEAGCVCHMHCSNRSLLYSMALRMVGDDQACHETIYSALIAVLSAHLHS